MENPWVRPELPDWKMGPQFPQTSGMAHGLPAQGKLFSGGATETDLRRQQLHDVLDRTNVHFSDVGLPVEPEELSSTYGRQHRSRVGPPSERREIKPWHEAKARSIIRDVLTEHTTVPASDVAGLQSIGISQIKGEGGGGSYGMGHMDIGHSYETLLELGRGRDVGNNARTRAWVETLTHEVGHHASWKRGLHSHTDEEKAKDPIGISRFPEEEARADTYMMGHLKTPWSDLATYEHRSPHLFPEGAPTGSFADRYLRMRVPGTTKAQVPWVVNNQQFSQADLLKDREPE